jgi:hypothetical protein
MSFKPRGKPIVRTGFWESIWALVFVVGLAGCVTTGSIGGRLSVPGEPVAGVTFSFQSERFGEGGRLTVALPSGEYFSGRYLQITLTSTADVIQPISISGSPTRRERLAAGASENASFPAAERSTLSSEPSS